MTSVAQLSDEAIVSAVTDDLPVGVWVARAPTGQFVYANKRFAEIMGMAGRSDVAVGEYAAPYGIHTRDGTPYPEESMPFVRAVRTRAIALVDDIVIHRTDGKKVNIRAQARPVFDSAGELTHVVIAFIDITREVTAEAARIESDLRLYHAQKMDSIGNLAGGVAHDFNNLLGATKILIGLLRSDESNPDKRAHLDQLDEITDSAASLTRALLGFAQRGKNLSQPLSVNEVVLGVAKLLTRTLDPVFTVVHALDARADTVVGDFSQLQQVVMNLAVNARDAMPGGGVIAFRTHDAPRGAGTLAPHVVIDVEDGGSGIDPAIRDRIFEPYFTTKGDVGGGTGLGLAMAYGIVRNHGGTIEARRREPTGTKMRVELPAVRESVDSRAPPSVTPAASVGASRGGILVIDDDANVRKTSALVLRHLGYTVFTACDGVEGVEQFLAQRDQIGGVVLDMTMPRMDGRATYEALRAIDPSVRVLLMTGHALDEAAQRILDRGVRGFLSKPFSLRELDDALSAVLGEPGSR